MKLERQQIRIRGVVQGVGFRPFVWRLATESQLTGWILNDGGGVLIEVQGSDTAIEQFLKQLQHQRPPLASITECLAKQVPTETGPGSDRFLIRSSRHSQVPTASVPADVAMCAECEHEMLDPANRRYRYPFINCTNCGPRFTIIRELPYDRPQTTMAGFELCAECLDEYQNPADRRFHAQPNACPTCGPRIWLEVNPDRQSAIPIGSTGVDLANCRVETRSDAVIAAARKLVLAGGVLAIKGIGGFHLACNALNEDAVARLRQRKQRPDKPLALMVADLATAHQLATIDAAEERMLTSPQRPIVLLSKQVKPVLATGGQLASKIAPGNPLIGLLLPYAPLHRLLIESGECWVMTSGNLSDEPIARDNDEALSRLSEVCDAFLVHDRPIEAVCDDSVVISFRSKPLPIRRSRGYCPLPTPLPRPAPLTTNDETVGQHPMGKLKPNDNWDEPCVLAVGGELKAAICLAHSDQAILGQHLGDMGNLETLRALERSVEHLLRLYQAKPVAIATDTHPGYLSAQWAQEYAQKNELPLLRVQHHHAHAVALMAEHGMVRASDSIIACVFDGTGFGSDGAIWGGEWLVASPQTFQRFAQLEYMPLPGGDTAIERPAKIALAQLFHCDLDWNEGLPCLTDLSEIERKVLRQQLQKELNTVRTSSMGRLFDCVAALIGLRQRVHYEGQAAIELEHLAAHFIGDDFASPTGQAVYPTAWQRQANWVLNYRWMLAAIIRDLHSGIDQAEIAARFHRTIASATREICDRAREETGISVVGLTGGVFQNVLLAELIQRELEQANFKVLTHGHVPPNDGGLALGQAVVGRSILSRSL